MLRNFEINEFKILQLKTVSKDVSSTLIVNSLCENFIIPNIITVRVANSENKRSIVLEIKNRAILLPKLSGYKNIMNNFETCL